MQNAMLLLVSGDGNNQPQLLTWLDERGLLDRDGLDAPPGQSVMAENYSDRYREIEGLAERLEKQNASVDVSRLAAFDTSSRAYRNIRDVITGLQTTLGNAPGPTRDPDGVYRLPPAVEATLTRALLTAVDEVHDEVSAATQKIGATAHAIDRAAPAHTVVPTGRHRSIMIDQADPAGRVGYTVANLTDPVQIAMTQLGVGELGGSSNIVRAEYGINAPWCASFATWVWRKAGYRIDWTDKNRCSKIWQDAAALNLRAPAAQAAPGDLILFDRNRNGEPDHIGIVERTENGVIHTIEGNASDRVRRHSYTVGSSNMVGVVKQPPASGT